ncbi:hypothetical protein ETB97_005986 [Aspergillus alliaceus]|uniref:Uncharacterized protein n=1 Tax=Petromyces alliaceus TaxID=209559 RepID=A0A5N6G7K5_PETAA|nr:uncharacterized protein BDW43DRAFT_201972 [Aspergillus alliaceus]KAB8237180.1 hypothetical protein BDW43DRAFT_201972 [Aspergillus alliaceus]KAE8390408.1 hypothetical protein BDV23DRAFT_86317 [Aspergillus alliaceus]KAF5857302.1 hypothetical protein ETB97_005986 [Aspergillus burnettii]
MSSTTSSPAATATSCNTGSIWQLPIQDAACALPKSGNYSDIMDKCCSPAKVTEYDDGCGLYCLAQGQSVKDLTECLRDNGAKDGQFFCNKEQNATATQSAPSSTKTGDKTGSSTSSGASSTSSDNAAYAIQPAVSKSGLGLLVMVFCSALMGVVA